MVKIIDMMCYFLTKRNIIAGDVEHKVRLRYIKKNLTIFCQKKLIITPETILT